MILVAGADGFVARHVVSRLVENGESVRAMVRNVPRATKVLPAQSVELVVGDTTRPETLESAVTGVDTIVHGAFIVAIRKEGPGVNYHQTNVVGTKNLVEAARNAGVRRICVLGGLGTKPSSTDRYLQGRLLGPLLAHRFSSVTALPLSPVWQISFARLRSFR
jgi:nucleoside-diphosphate-sugar epimerase